MRGYTPKIEMTFGVMTSHRDFLIFLIMIQQAIREYVEYVVQVYGVVCLFYKPAWPNDIFVENLNTTYDDKILFDVLRKSFLYFPENHH